MKISSSRSPWRKAWSTSMAWISMSLVAAKWRNTRAVLCLAVGAHVSKKSTPCFCENPFATSLDLKCGCPSGLLLIRYTHLHLTTFLALLLGTGSRVPVSESQRTH